MLVTSRALLDGGFDSNRLEVVLDSIEFGSVPDVFIDIYDAILPSTNSVDEALDDIELKHTYTPTLTEGQAQIDGVPECEPTDLMAEIWISVGQESSLKRRRRSNPRSSAWEADALPLSYSRSPSESDHRTPRSSQGSCHRFATIPGGTRRYGITPDDTKRSGFRYGRARDGAEKHGLARLPTVS